MANSGPSGPRRSTAELSLIELFLVGAPELIWERFSAMFESIPPRTSPATGGQFIGPSASSVRPPGLIGPSDSSVRPLSSVRPRFHRSDRPDSSVRPA